MNTTTLLLQEIDKTLDDVRIYFKESQEPPERVACDITAKLELLTTRVKNIAQQSSAATVAASSYQKATHDQIVNGIDLALRKALSKPELTPHQQQLTITNYIGIYHGVCLARGFDPSLTQTIIWATLT